MAGSIVVAQGTTPPGTTPPKVVTVIKPDSNQAITIHLDGSTKLDLSAIANENITLVHVGDRLIILFANHAEVTIDPFYSDNGQPLPNITVELGPDHDVSSSQFATDFPITTDQSVLPASGGPNSVSSGANFSSFSIDTFAPNGTGLALLGSESPNGPTGTEATNTPTETIPPSLTGALASGTVVEGGLVTDTFNSQGGNSQGSDFTAHGVTGSLDALVTFGTGGPATPAFQFVSPADANAWLASLGLTSHGSAIDVATITGNTLVASTDAGQPFAHDVFSLTVNSDGSWTFTLLNPLDHPTGQGANSLDVDLSGLVQAVDVGGLAVTLSKDFIITVTDDVPGLTAATSSGTVDEAALAGPAAPGDLFGTGSEVGNPAFHASFSGNLEDLVSFGADGSAAKITGGISEANGYQFAVASGDSHDFFVQSHGQEVNFVTIADNAPGADGVSQTLTAWTNGGPANDPTSHEVFTLTLNGDGTYVFTLINPLDDDIGDDNTQFTLDLSSLVKGVDFDGDTIPLAGDFSITVTNDTPGSLVVTPEAGHVEETALTAATDQFGSGSGGGLASHTGALTLAASFGADGPFEVNGVNEAVRFAIPEGGTADSALLPGMTSHGDLIGFFTVTTSADETSQTLTAFAGGSVADGGHEVFTLLLNGDGTYTFTLINPIDDLTGPNHDVPAASITLDLSPLIALRDFDGDRALLPPGAFTMTLNDDQPQVNTAATAVTASVDESGLVSASLVGGTDTHGDGSSAGVAGISASGTSGSLTPLVNFGADGFGKFQLVDATAAGTALASQGITSHGFLVDHATVTNQIDPVTNDVVSSTLTALDSNNDAVFTLQVNPDGSWAFNLLEPLDNGPNQGATATTIDLSGLVQAVDFDADPVTLANDFKITVNDDAPVVSSAPAVTATVDESGLTNPPNTHGSGSHAGVDATSAHGDAGSLTALVNFGADGPGAFAVTNGPIEVNFNSLHDVQVLQAQGLESHGAALQTVSVTINPNGTSELVATDSANHEMFDLVVSGDGSWTFTQMESLDNGPNQHASGTTIDLSGVIQAIDADGSTLNLANDFKITVADDAPVTNGAMLTSVVFEGGLTAATDTHGTGNDPAAIISVSSTPASMLQLLVNFGADGAAVTAFKLVDAIAATNYLETLNLSSHGSPLEGAQFNPATDTLTALNGNGDKVFTLTVNGDGSWTFNLLEPLDDGPNQSENGTTIDLSGLIQAVDFDGSATTLSGDFKISVADDVPQVSTTTAILGTVNESGLTSVTDTHGVGNSPGAETSQTGSGVTSLQNLVLYGADGPGTFGFVDATTAGTFLAAQNLTSHGFLINGATIDTTTHTLTATDSNGDHVFTLTVNGDGSWTFNLLEPLDDGAGMATIKLSGLVQAFDFDGSPVTLANDFQITVTDDTPTLTGSFVGSVDEGGLTAATDPFGTGNDTGAAIASGGSLGIQFGADGAAAVSAVSFADPVNAFNNVSATDTNHNPVSLTSHGVALEFALIDAQTLVAYTGATAPTTISDASVVFSVVLSATAANGSYDFVLDKPLDQSLAGPGSLNLVFDFTAKDFDGTTVTGSFTVTDADDAPITNDIRLSTAIEEGALELGVPTPVVQTVAAPGLTQLVDFGADGAAATAFKPVDKTAGDAFLNSLHLTSNGNAVDHTVVTGASLVAEDTNNNVVFTLTVNGDGSFTFEQNAPIDGVPVNGTHALDISGFINAIDFDGSAKTLPAGDVAIEIDNDRPVVADVHASGNENTPNPPSTITTNASPIHLTLSETDGFPGVTATFTVNSLPANGTLFLSDGVTPVVAGTAYAATGGTLGLIFEPNAFFAGTTSFQYTATNSNGATSPSAATVTIDVSPVADPPAIASVLPADVTTGESTDAIGSQTVALAGGGFVETWQGNSGSETVFAQILNASGAPVGSPITVGTNPAGTNPNQDETGNEVVALKGGGFAVAFVSAGNLFIQVYDAHGVAAGGLQQVDTHVSSIVFPAQLTATSDGEVAVLYSGTDSSNNIDVYTRVFAANGTAGPDQLVNTVPAGEPPLANPFNFSFGVFNTPGPEQMATLPHGYAVAWTGFANGQSAEFVRVFNDDGSPATPAMQVSAPPSGANDGGFESGPGGMIVALANGDFAVTWQENVAAIPAFSEIFTKVYHAADNYAGEQTIQVSSGNATGNASTENLQQIIALSTGGYAVMWQQDDSSGTVVDTFVQVYDNNGHPTDSNPADANGIQVALGSASAGTAFPVQMEALAGGHFAVLWDTASSASTITGGDLYVRVYAADGTPVSGPVEVAAADSTSKILGVQVVKFADGGFAVVYDKVVSDGSGGTSDHVFVQQFGADGTAVGSALALKSTPADLGNFSGFEEFRAALSNDGLLLVGGTTFDAGTGASAVDFASVNSAMGQENTPIALANISIPSDPTETFKVTLSGFPPGATFTVNGTTVGALDAASGNWVISDPAQIALLDAGRLTLVPPTGFTGTFSLHVDAVSSDTALLSTGSTTSTAESTANITVTVTDANDVTLHNPAALAALSGSGAQSFGIAAPVDADNGNDLKITITAVPGYGTVQYTDVNGTHVVTDGMVLTAAELTSLTYTPPATGVDRGDNLVYTVQDGPNSVVGSIAVSVADGQGELFFSGDGQSGQLNPDLFTLDTTGHLASIPLNPPNGSFAGEDGGYIQFANGLYFNANTDATGEVLFRLGADNVAHAVTDASGHTISAINGVSADYTIYDGSLYFIAQGSTGTDLFKIDPTGVVTEINVNPGGQRVRPVQQLRADRIRRQALLQRLQLDIDQLRQDRPVRDRPEQQCRARGHGTTAFRWTTPARTAASSRSTEACSSTRSIRHSGTRCSSSTPMACPRWSCRAASRFRTHPGRRRISRPSAATSTSRRRRLGFLDGLFQIYAERRLPSEILYSGHNFDFVRASLSNSAASPASTAISSSPPRRQTSDGVPGRSGFAPNPVLFQLDSHGNVAPVTDAGQRLS